MKRKMPDRILDNFSNLRTVVTQFRELGKSDTEILETVMNIADIKNQDNIPTVEEMIKMQQQHN